MDLINCVKSKLGRIVNSKSDKSGIALATSVPTFEIPLKILSKCRPGSKFQSYTKFD